MCKETSKISSHHIWVSFISCVNSSREIYPSPLASIFFIRASSTFCGSLFSPAVKTYLISDGEMEPEPSLSNILKAACRRSFVMSAFSFMEAITNSV